MSFSVPNTVNETFQKTEKNGTIFHFPLAFGVICQTGGPSNKCTLLVTKNLKIMRNFKSQDCSSCPKKKATARVSGVAPVCVWLNCFSFLAAAFLVEWLQTNTTEVRLRIKWIKLIEGTVVIKSLLCVFIASWRQLTVDSLQWLQP